jgi:hypothetical protein
LLETPSSFASSWILISPGTPPRSDPLA